MANMYKCFWAGLSWPWPTSPTNILIVPFHVTDIIVQTPASLSFSLEPSIDSSSMEAEITMEEILAIMADLEYEVETEDSYKFLTQTVNDMT